MIPLLAIEGHLTRSEERMRRFLWAAAGYGTCLALLALAYATSLIGATAALVIGSAILAVNGAFYFLFRSGLADTFADPELVWPQTLCAIAILALGAYWFDYDRALLLLGAFAVVTLGLYRFETREFLIAAALVVGAYAVTSGLMLWLKPEVVERQRQALHLLVLVLAMPPFALLCAQVTNVGRRMRPAFRELSTAVATIEQLTKHDRLTRLANRAMFVETLSSALAVAHAEQRQAAVMFLDLDRFKNVNDTLGHGAGDRILEETARRLLATMRSGDFVARLGGDEFVVVIESFRDETELADMASRILNAFKPMYRIDGRSLAVSASIGIAVFPEGGSDCDTLLSSADVALYRAKEQGRNRFCFYSSDLNRVSHERLSLEAGMARALENNEFEVWYQPKVAFRAGRVKGAEALVRWRHPEHGLLMPGRFIPLAEESGLIEAMDLWVVRHVCERARHWRLQGTLLPPIAVNLSANQLHRADLVDALASILSETQATGDTIELEITETAVMRDPERAVAVLEGLRNMGVRLAIDDFGMGHSSLGYLKRFPVDTLKIDRTFVKDLPHDRDDIAITRAIIAMAHSLKVGVVAEGVERRDQFDVLRAEGCDQYQGFLCQPALPEKELIGFLAQHLGPRTSIRRRHYAAPASLA